MCRKCTSKLFREDALSPPLLSLAPKEILMPWTLTMSPYPNSPPSNRPNASEKVAASDAERLVTMPQLVAPLIPVLPPTALKTFTSWKLLPLHLPKTSPPSPLAPSSTNMSTRSRLLAKVMTIFSLSSKYVTKNHLRNWLKYSLQEYKEHRIFKKGSYPNVLFPYHWSYTCSTMK